MDIKLITAIKEGEDWTGEKRALILTQPLLSFHALLISCQESDQKSGLEGCDQNRGEGISASLKK